MEPWIDWLFQPNPMTECNFLTRIIEQSRNLRDVRLLEYLVSLCSLEGDLDSSGAAVVSFKCMICLADSCQHIGCFALSLCSLRGVPQTIIRGKMRHQYGIEGDGCGDCMVNFCCRCCTLVQGNKEVKT